MSRREWAVMCVVVVAFAAGSTAGVMLARWVLPQWAAAEPIVPGDPDHDHDDEHPEVHLSDEAQKLLGLKVQAVHPSDYWRRLRVPGVIVEKPGHSNRVISTTVNGIITKVHVVPGQAVNAGDPLFDLQLTGEALATAQAALLETLQRLDINAAELKRISGLAETGGVAGKQKLELEYEQQRLESQRNVRAQELLVRGLNPQQIDRIMTTQELVREFTVRVPDRGAGELDRSASASPSAADDKTDDWEFTVETLGVFPGRAVRPGDDLCHLADHTELYVEGQAFAREVEAVGITQRNGWPVALEFGTGTSETVREGYRIHYLDNHVDAEAQTFRFYISLRNEVLLDSLDEQGTLFRSWRFKPGQRVHVVIPVEKWERQLKLPLSAVVQEGAHSYVFRHVKATHTHPPEKDDPEQADHEHEDAFEVLPVRVLHQDSQFAVVSADGELKPGDPIAINHAYQLYLAWKLASGGGHEHSHEH